MSSASFNSILALFCRIFKYKFGMNNKVVIKLSCVIGNLDINQSNRHYNAYWRGPNKEADEKSAYNNVQVGDGPQHREIGSVISTDNASWRGPNIENFEKKFYKQCKLGKDNKFKIQCVTLICYYNDNLQNYMKNE
ncbi:hypothetical protein A4R85_01640 [Staphylococcus aureus]|uniref:Nitrogen regulation protein NIFR3 n=18 Tax=Staphylococcus aureus TaxID=1280 RepID=A0AB74E619_STAAU|nr:conserved hypothetical protein [Staphylococcus aureus subsp. aureus str. JKD6008]AEB87447.1 hypothetical protein SAT0131_00346 [Staphylococcus aureus subsp. aureus T0131]AGY88443.1 Hypothetical protein SAZ172_0342 [Staphylococcus aureus subsp. aureus Z172]AID38830.1 hypothetical protein SAXN108_0389 [Staphylococcus aureus]EFM07206.1 hypothetical protein HMPREF0783_1316 [Staphylococcus aureus subsp. aureus ATCC BAA-39]EHM60473.1 hypothetical protein SA21178_1852 [Staphylococcus aureus subsp.